MYIGVTIPTTVANYLGTYNQSLPGGYSGNPLVSEQIVTNYNITTNSLVVTNTAPRVLGSDTGYFRWK